MDQQKTKTDQKLTKPAEALMRIIHGDIKDISLVHKKIITGKKFRNLVLRQLVNEYRKIAGMKDDLLLDIVLSLDESIEKEIVTNELLDYIKDDPEFFKKIILNTVK
jgi:hypothetical protein